MKKALSLFLILVLISGCASGKKTEAKITTPVEPLAVDSEEAVTGRTIHEQILQSFYPYTEPKVVAYVNRIGQSLAEHAERKELPYRFTILYNDKIYATSAPGGYIYVTTGMLYFIESEAELAAVLAHEVGELQYKDPRLSQSRRMLGAVTQGGAVVLPAFGPLGMLAVVGLMAVHSAEENKAGDFEGRIQKADRRALHYMVEAGQDPQGMMSLFEQFANANKEIAPYFLEYYQSRPISMERIHAMQKEFERLPLAGKEFTAKPREYQEVMRGVRDMYKY